MSSRMKPNENLRHAVKPSGVGNAPNLHAIAPSALQITIAFAAIYIVWGSTYLVIRFGIETIPPFVMAGSRFLLAGLGLYVWCRMRGAEKPTLVHWRSAAIVGGLLLFIGNGCVTWAEKTVPSGAAALMVTTVPIWMVVLNWLRPHGVRPGWAEIVGLVLGIGGVAVLMGSERLAGAGAIPTTGAIVLIAGALSWSIGSLYSRGAKFPDSKWLTIAMEMVCGGVLLWVFACFTGDWAKFDLSEVSRKSLLSVLYLSVFGSLIGFGAYIWLLGVTTPARVATYAFVNPIVAVLIGYAFGGEALTTRVLVASAVIVTGVVIITLYGKRSPSAVSNPQPHPSSEDRSGGWRHDCGGCAFSIDELGDAHEKLNRPYYEFLRRDTLSAGVYEIAAGGIDQQKPHAEDEIYYVLRGRGQFRIEDAVHQVKAGTLLYVPARVMHRFENITQALQVLVFFAPPETTVCDEGKSAAQGKLPSVCRH